MEIFTIISEFLTQYLPDFSAHAVEYLLLGVLVFLIIGVFKR